MKNSTRFAATLATFVLATASLFAPVAGAAQLAAPDGIPVGSLPLDVAFSRDGKLAFVTNHDSDSVSVINTKSQTVVNTIALGALGDQPMAIERSKNNKFMYVTNRGEGTVSVLDIKRQTVVSTWEMASATEACRLTPKGTLLACITAELPYELNFYKASDGSFTRSISLPGGGQDVDFSKNGKTAYYVDISSNDMIRVDLTAGDTFNDGWMNANSGWPAPSPDKKLLFIPDFDLDVIKVYSLASNTSIASIGLGGCGSSSLASRPRGKFMYVTCFTDGRIDAINIKTFEVDRSKRVQTEAGIDGITVNPSGTQAYVTNPMTNEVWVIKGLK